MIIFIAHSYYFIFRVAEVFSLHGPHKVGQWKVFSWLSLAPSLVLGSDLVALFLGRFSMTVLLISGGGGVNVL